MSPARRSGLIGVAAAVALSGALAFPATASTMPRSGALPCLARGGHGTPKVPAARRFADTTRVRAADLAAVPEVLRNGRIVGLGLPRRVVIPVYVHVIKGTHRGERSPAGPKRIRRMIRILNGGFDGAQWKRAHRSRYTFRLRHTDYTTREGWYHAYLFGPRDKRMKRALHRGDRNDLNLYVNGGGPKGQPVLGWSRFPWQYRHTPRLDSVTVNWKAMPGGSVRHYNRGDTVVHETGHWMGLFHTFQRGCHAPGDKVADTQAEGSPSYFCDNDSDTCPHKRGKDPVHNFMDYSFDSCMTHFTPGQIDRMDRSFAKYRRTPVVRYSR